MPRSLVIVESPAKAKTIAGYLGDDYVVESSIGHIRDLPRNAKDVPAAYKSEKWARLGVDTENDFKPLYVISSDKKDHVRTLKTLLKDVDELFLATDEDREGEAIAWHLLEVLNPQVPVKRMVFHEITKAAIEAAIEAPRELDRHLVDAQEARRILDRLFGYEVSPVLWRKVSQGLSAGRVQSVATRIVVEREWERMKFVRAGYWSIDAAFTVVEKPEDGPDEMTAKLLSVDDKRLATGRDFDDAGIPAADAFVLDETGANQLVAELADTDFSVSSRESRPYRRRPAPPFMTSTLQQAGGRLRMSAQQVMRAAQSLYEKGFITYMRTDSSTLSDTAINAARSEITLQYGKDYLPDEPRQYATKVKNAQQAHEAIRPAGDTFRSPEEVGNEVGGFEAQVYDLIWKRTIASQMTDAVGETVTIRLSGLGRSGQEAVFSASGTVISHPGHQRVYGAVSQDDNDDEERRLPAVSEGDRLDPRSFEAEGHTTQPPARYSEASLVKRLEDLGIGRPSTYASIMTTIQDRGYVWKKGTALVPEWRAFAVVNVLVKHFPDLVDYAFTARIEDDLDAIAGGTSEAIPWLRRFYFGEDGVNGQKAGSSDTNGASESNMAAIGLKELVSDRLDDIDAAEVNSIPIGTGPDGRAIIVKPGRYGPYIQRGEGEDRETAGVPVDLAPDELTVERAIEVLETPTNIVLGDDPASGLQVQLLNGRNGPYVQLGEFVEGEDPPKRSSLFASMSPDSVTLEDALRVLQLPRTLGLHPETGETITANNGPFGPYLRKIKLTDEGELIEGLRADNRNLDSEERLLEITLDEAVKIYAEPKRGRGATARPPLKELGKDIGSGLPMVVKDGRFGQYVTDGETNATVKDHDTVENLTDERASELLQARREYLEANPDKKKKKKAAAKKKAAPKKKVAAKKKAAPKKAAPKKKVAAKKAVAE